MNEPWGRPATLESALQGPHSQPRMVPKLMQPLDYSTAAGRQPASDIALVR